MKKYIPIRGKDTCPICDSNSGKCRLVIDGNKEIILCMSLPDEKFGTIINNYKCIRSDSRVHTYSGSVWAIDNSTEWSEEQRRERQEQKIQRQQQQAREEQERLQRSLSVVERDHHNRSLLQQLDLHPDDKKDLLQRGFTEEQIEQAGFKSVRKYQKLSVKLDPRLPGVSKCGSYLLNAHDGYLCPVRNHEGLIIGIQYRLRQLPEGDGNRYRWLSSDTSVLKLPHGENPIGFYMPSSGKPDGIALVDSLGPKAFLAAERLNKIVIGAAGGQFAASPQLFSLYLEKAQKIVGTKTVIIYPDAGDVINRSVCRKLDLITKLITDLRYVIEFAWWGQITKEDCDIDELTSYEAISYLTADEFWETAKKAKEDCETAKEERQARLKVEAEEQIYKFLTTVTEPAWKVVNEAKLNLKELIEPGAIYIVLSAKGTCKTEGLKPIVENHKACYAWFSRIALGREECHRIGLTWKDEHPTFGKGKKRGFCSDSAHQFDPKGLSEDALLIVDEADQVFDHNFGDTCNKDGKRPLILATFEAHLETAIASGGTATFLSADITQKEIDYIKALAPSGCPVRLIVNEYKPPKGDLYFDESDKPDGLIEELLLQLENDEPCFVIDDIKDGIRGCKSIAEYVRTIHPEWSDEIVEINSDTTGEVETTNYIKNANEASNKTRLICCSPSVVSGISITNGRFVKGVYGFCNGVLTVSQMSQALGRIRGAKITKVWAAERGLLWAANRAKDPREISEWYHRNYEANSKHILSYGTEYDPIKSEWSSPHWKLKCQNDAYRNLCMEKLRERLKARLEEEGFNIKSFSNNGSDMVANGLKTAWSKIEIEEAEAVAAANILNEEQMEALQYQTEPLTPEEKLDVEKTLLFKWFGEELINATTFTHKATEKVLTGYAAMFLKNERGEYRRKLENFYLLVSEASEAVAKDVAAESRQMKHGHGRFPGDVSWKLRQRKAREWLGLPAFLDPQKWSTPADYQQLESKAKSKVELMKDVLRFNPEKVSASQIFTELLAQLGLELDKEWVSVPAGQKRYKRRRIEAESWKFAQMYVEHRQSLKTDEVASQPAAATAVVAAEEPAVKPVVEAKPQPVYRQMELSEVTPTCDHPPLFLYTEPIFRGGVIRDSEDNCLESQRNTGGLVSQVVSSEITGLKVGEQYTTPTMPDTAEVAPTEPLEAFLEPGKPCWYLYAGKWVKALLLRLPTDLGEPFVPGQVEISPNFQPLVLSRKFLEPCYG